MKKTILQLLSIVLIVTFAVACSSKYKGYDKSTTGLYYKIYKLSKDTAKPKTGDYISVDLRYAVKKKGKDSVLFDSKATMKGEHLKFPLAASDFKGDLYEGIRMLSAGDSAGFVINADSLFLKTFKMKQRPPMIDSNSVLYFFVYLVSFDSPERLKKKEMDMISKYISANNITVQPTSSGVYIIPTDPGNGIKMDTGCMVKLHFSVANIEGKQIFSSYDRPEPMKFQYGNRFDTKGIEEAIGTLKKGGKAKVIVPSSMAFGEAGKGNIVPPFSTLVYKVEILDIQSKADYEKEQAAEKKKAELKKQTAKKDEAVERAKYLKEHKITTKPTKSGLYYIERAKGTGPQAIPGKQVKLHYTGTLLNGKKFDSSLDRNKPFEFILGRGQVVPGWDEGIALMKQGGKATLIIPSDIAYGDQPNQNIPAFSTLVFEVELLEVADPTPPKTSTQPVKTGKK